MAEKCEKCNVEDSSIVFTPHTHSSSVQHLCMQCFTGLSGGDIHSEKAA